MASKREVQPAKTDGTSSNDRVYRIDGLSQPINNLEHFPLEILISTFAEIDDVGLLHLSNISNRFEAIAKDVFKERYMDKYFVIEGESERQKEVYREQFQRFGSSIKAVEANGFEHIGSDHWMVQMLQKHTKCLEKLTFNRCSFVNGTDILSQHMNVTHLVFRDEPYSSDIYIELPEYRNLRKLELSDFRHISVDSLKQTFRNNPQLENLTIRFCNHYFTLPEIMEQVNKHLNHLTELDVLENYDFNREFPLDSPIDVFANSLRGLESLAIPVESEIMELLRRLSSNCKNIKRLELYHMSNNLDNEMVEIIRSFDKIETLIIQQQTYDDEIELLVHGLPNLRDLFLSMETTNPKEYILSLLCKCGSLEKISIDRDLDRDEPMRYVNHSFYSQFVDAAQSPQLKVEIIENGQSIGILTKTEAVWRNKLLHWVGFESIDCESGLNLLDLANSQKATNPEQKLPFDLILDQLDLNSLFSLSKTSTKSEQLINSYIQKCSVEQKEFFITDEFDLDYNGLQAFGQYVNNLKLNVLCYNITELCSLLENHFANLNRLCIRTQRDIYPHEFIIPQVRHFVYHGYGFQMRCNLDEMSLICPDLEILELYNDVRLYAGYDDCSHSFRHLKEIKFKTRDETQVKFVNELFRNMKTKVVVVS